MECSHSFKNFYPIALRGGQGSCSYLIFFFFFKLEDNCFAYFDSFCHTPAWIDIRYRYVPSILNLPPISHPITPPSRLSQSTGLGFPASYIELPLVILCTYGKVCISMLFFQSIPPSPSSTVQNSVLYVCVSIGALHVGFSALSF